MVSGSRQVMERLGCVVLLAVVIVARSVVRRRV